MAPASFTLWQPHFDRDFASVMELLSIPLYGPGALTQSLAPKDTTNNNLTFEQPGGRKSASPDGGRELSPAHRRRPSSSGRSTPSELRPVHPSHGLRQNLQYDNRWHRIFELFEVPTRENLQVENYLQSNFPWLSPPLKDVRSASGPHEHLTACAMPRTCSPSSTTRSAFSLVVLRDMADERLHGLP